MNSLQVAENSSDASASWRYNVFTLYVLLLLNALRNILHRSAARGTGP